VRPGHLKRSAGLGRDHAGRIEDHRLDARSADVDPEVQPPNPTYYMSTILGLVCLDINPFSKTVRD
jgi:hypothetical protein